MLLLLFLFGLLFGGAPFLVAASSEEAGVAEPAIVQVRASLAITVWPDGTNGRVVRWTLRCGPPGGTLPSARNACVRLGNMVRPFAPVPPNTACAEVYGGPGKARVRGSLRGRAVDARFDRRNACETARWDRVRFLFRTSR